MSSETKSLEILKGKQILDIDTEIDIVAPINSPEQEIQIEIPLRLIFDQYSLLIYNQWSIISPSGNRINDLKRQAIVEILIESEILTFRIGDSNIIRVNLNDSGYTGPEAMVLYGPENLIVVWN